MQGLAAAGSPGAFLVVGGVVAIKQRALVVEVVVFGIGVVYALGGRTYSLITTVISGVVVAGAVKAREVIFRVGADAVGAFAAVGTRVRIAINIGLDCHDGFRCSTRHIIDAIDVLGGAG
jgi:hypothetical protein